MPADQATRRRDQRLAQARRLTLCGAGGAAAASLGLGTAFAHTLPGHRAAAAAAQPVSAPPRHGRPAGAGTVSVRPAGTAPGYSGPVVNLDGHRLMADLRGPGGAEARATITLFIRHAVATGTLTVGPRGEQ